MNKNGHHTTDIDTSSSTIDHVLHVMSPLPNAPKQSRLNLRNIMQLQLDPELMNKENNCYNNDEILDAAVLPLQHSPQSKLVFRQEGISIGYNFLRIDGETYSRNTFCQSQNLIIHEMIGHGAFSTVYRATRRQPPMRLCNDRPVNTTEIDGMKNKDVIQQEQNINVAIKVWSVRDLSSTQRLNMLLKELRDRKSVV